MQQRYIMFLENYTGASGKLYEKNVKYKIKRIKDNCAWFDQDSIPEALQGKVYKIGNIVTNIYTEKEESHE